MPSEFEILKSRLKDYVIRFKREKDVVKTENKCNRCIKDFEDIKSELENLDGFESLGSFDTIDELNVWFNETTQSEIREKLEDVESQLRKIIPHFGFTFEDSDSSMKKNESTPPSQQQPIFISIRQDAKQIQTNQQIINQNFDHLIQAIQNSEIPNYDKEIAKNKIQELNEELNKTKPDKGRLKNILEWAIDFSKKYGSDVILTIYQKILDIILR